MAGRLGELLVRENLISLQQLQKAQEEQKKAGGRIGYHLTKLGFIEESELTNFLSKQYGVPSINRKEFDIDAEVVRLVPKDVAEKHQCIPVNRAGASLILAMSDPSNIYAIDDIKFLTGYNIEVVVASEQAIKEALEKYYTEKGPSYEELMEGFDENERSEEHTSELQSLAYLVCRLLLEKKKRPQHVWGPAELFPPRAEDGDVGVRDRRL